MKELKIAGIVIATVVAIGIIMNAKDIARYIRISTM
jgi:hypothetical protein